MYFDEAHNDAEGHRSLIVEREKTSELFQNMSGNAILFAVFGTCETSYYYQDALAYLAALSSSWSIFTRQPIFP